MGSVSTPKPLLNCLLIKYDNEIKDHNIKNLYKID